MNDTLTTKTDADRNSAIVKKALAEIGEASIDAERFERDAATWASRPTKKHTREARVAGIKRALARVGALHRFGGTMESAVEQVRRALL